MFSFLGNKKAPYICKAQLTLFHTFLLLRVS
nr:MAG TPA: hypothetical protein [Bacteriophage sp.]